MGSRQAGIHTPVRAKGKFLSVTVKEELLMCVCVVCSPKEKNGYFLFHVISLCFQRELWVQER